jgi:hypothetical protein
MRWIVFVFAGFLAMSAAISEAAGIPAATSQLVVYIDNNQLPLTSGKFTTIKESYATDYGSSESGLASSTKGSTQTLHVHGTRRCNANGCLGSPDSSTSQVAYAFRVVGPKGTVKVDFTAVASTSYNTSVVGGAMASYQINGLTGPIQFCAGSQYLCSGYALGSEGFSFDEQGTVDIKANTVYNVYLLVDGEPIGGDNSSTTVDASLSATIKLDPMYEGSYTLQLSKGILPTP